MKKYDYFQAVKEDVLNYIKENEITITEENREDVEEQLNEDCWISDSVTGNASGSYTLEQWQQDGNLKVQVGQLIDDHIFTQLFECMPPNYYSRGIFQPGEAYDHDADKGAPLYMTFKNTSNGWQYMGICRTGETVQRVGYCSQFLAV